MPVQSSEHLVNASVLAVEDLELEDVPESTEDHVIEVWGHRIITNIGICTISMRVEHTGYYGGRLTVKAADMITEGAKPLTDDL